MTENGSFWKRLLDRKIVQWGGAYLAGAVVLLEFSNFLDDAFNWPRPLMPVLTVLVAFGFLAVLIVSWYHGERGHQRVTSTEVILIGVLALLAGSVAWHQGTSAQARPGQRRPPGMIGSRTPADTTERAGFSIAVLPFKNIGVDPENDYFADGITEDITSALSRISGWRVISRASMMQYRDPERNIGQIGRTLRVDAILDGSVQREDNQVRVRAELIDVATDEILWSNAFDRELSSILALQSDVSQSIAQALERNPRFQLEPVVASAPRPDVNPAAYDLYARGVRLADTGDPDSIARAMQLFAEAVTLDSTLVMAYAKLARTVTPADVDPIELPRTPPDEQVERLIQRGIEQAPDAPELRATMILRRAMDADDIGEAIDSLERAVEQFPNNADLRRVYGMLLARQGEYASALDELRQAQALNPGSSTIGATIGSTLLAAGRIDEAIQQMRTVVERDDDDAIARMDLALAFQAGGHADSAIAHLERARRDARRQTAPFIAGTLGQVYAASGDTARAQALLDELQSRGGERGSPAVAVAQILVGLGRLDEAATWLAEHPESRSGAYLSSRVLRSLAPLRGMPSYESWLRDSRGRGGRDGRGGREGRGGRGR